MSHPFITRIYVASFAGIRSRGSCVGIHLESCSPLVNVSSLVQVVAMRGRRGYALSIERVRRFEGKFDLRRLFSALLPLSRVLAISNLSRGLRFPFVFCVSPFRFESPCCLLGIPLNSQAQKPSAHSFFLCSFKRKVFLPGVPLSFLFFFLFFLSAYRGKISYQ